MDHRTWFGEFELDEIEGVLLQAGRAIPVQPKPLALLVYLLRNRQRIVPKEELLATIWPDVSVSEQALWSALRDLRRALGDIGRADPTIRTVRGRGFRFAAEISGPQCGHGRPSSRSHGPDTFVPAPRAAFVDRDDATATLRASLRAALGRSGHRAGAGDYRDISVVDEVDIALLSEAQAALGNIDSELHALVLARLALALRYGRPFHVADELSREAVRIAEACGGQATLAEALRYRHEVLSGPQFARDRLEIARRIVPLARAVRSRPLELDGLIFTSRDSFKLRDFAGAKQAGDAADALAATMHHPGALFRSGMRAVFVEMLRGHFELAERNAREFFRRDAARNMGAAGTLDLQLIMLAILRGDHAAAVEALRIMAARYPDLAWIDAGLAREHAARGEHAQAELKFADAERDSYRRLADHHSCLGAYLHLAEACVQLGDRSRAAELYERMLPYERLIAVPFFAIIWQGPVALGLGSLAVMLERDQQAQHHLELAAAMVEPLQSPPLLAMTRARLGGLLLRRRGKVERARGAELLQSAAALAERVGMRDVARESQTALAALQPDPEG